MYTYPEQLQEGNQVDDTSKIDFFSQYITSEEQRTVQNSAKEIAGHNPR